MCEEFYIEFKPRDPPDTGTNCPGPGCNAPGLWCVFGGGRQITSRVSRAEAEAICAYCNFAYQAGRSGDAPDLLKACRKDAERINQLCRTVNNLAAKLGLGNKVHAEDWDDIARAAIAKAEAGQIEVAPLPDDSSHDGILA